MLCAEDVPGAAEHSRRYSHWRGACCIVLSIVFFSGCAAGPPEPAVDLYAEAIVVLGNRPPTDTRGRVMPETQRRVRRGVELFQQGRAPEMVMAGGTAPRGDIEAEVMRDFAVALGVPEAAIRIETKSRNTIENARFTKDLWTASHDREHRPEILLVTSPAHLERARGLFECAGFVVHAVAAEPPPGFRDRNFARMYELMAALYYSFIDECAAARGE